MKKSDKPLKPKMAPGLSRKAQEGLLNPHQGVDMSHDDLMANADYELSQFFSDNENNG